MIDWEETAKRATVADWVRVRMPWFTQVESLITKLAIESERATGVFPEDLSLMYGIDIEYAEEIVAAWNTDYRKLRKEIEAIEPVEERSLETEVEAELPEPVALEEEAEEPKPPSVGKRKAVARKVKARKVTLGLDIAEVRDEIEKINSPETLMPYATKTAAMLLRNANVLAEEGRMKPSELATLMKASAALISSLTVSGPKVQVLNSNSNQAPEFSAWKNKDTDVLEQKDD